MLAYKAFNKDLSCIGYQYTAEGWNEEPEANCYRNGFHCAEDPLDCLTYYNDFRKARYWIVEAAGDIDEDNTDSKISCTRMRLIKELTLQEFVLEAVKYMVRHPDRGYKEGYQDISNGIEIVRGERPEVKTKVGTVIGLIQEKEGTIEAAGVTTVRTSKMVYRIENGRIVEKGSGVLGEKLGA